MPICGRVHKHTHLPLNSLSPLKTSLTLVSAAAYHLQILIIIIKPRSERLIVHQTISIVVPETSYLQQKQIIGNVEHRAILPGRQGAGRGRGEQLIVLPASRCRSHHIHMAMAWSSFTSLPCTVRVQRAAQCAKDAAGATACAVGDTACAAADTAQLQQHRAADAVQQVRMKWLVSPSSPQSNCVTVRCLLTPSVRAGANAMQGCRAGGADGPGRGGGRQGHGGRRPLIAWTGQRTNVQRCCMPKGWGLKGQFFPPFLMFFALTCFIHPSYCDCDRLHCTKKAIFTMINIISFQLHLH